MTATAGDASPLTVAVLGTGIMGAAMARNLSRAGHTVHAWNRGRAKAGPLAADGVQVAGTPKEAVAAADAVLTMLFSEDAVAGVISRAGPALRPGAAWVQSTTVGIDGVPRLAALAARYGVQFYDAPVSGTREPAEAGQLTVIAAGPQTGRGVVVPVFDAVGARTIWTGDDGAAGSAARLKLVVNSWVIAAANAAREIIAFAQAIGVDPQQFLGPISGGGLDLPFLRMKAGLILDHRLAPASFAVDTSAKDAHLIVAGAPQAGIRLDGAEASAARLVRAATLGHAAEDLAAAYDASFD